MGFNSNKFECLRYWPRDQKPTFIYLAPDSKVIKEKLQLRDLDVEKAFDIHILSVFSE